MAKYKILITIILGVAVLAVYFFAAKDALASFHFPKAYITKIEYSIDDPNFGSYNALTGAGVIATVTDSSDVLGGKIYKVASGVPTNFFGGSQLGFFEYRDSSGADGYVAEVDASVHNILYTRYTVKNSGFYQIQGLSAWANVASSAGVWGDPTNPNSWWYIDNFTTDLGFHDYLNILETKTEIHTSYIKNFPEGYFWKFTGLGWDDGTKMANDNYWETAVFYSSGPAFAPPTIDCPDANYEIIYGNTYSQSCVYTNNSGSNPAFLRIGDPNIGRYYDWSTRLAGTYQAVYWDAVYSHDFIPKIITIPAGGSVVNTTTATIDESYSPWTRNVNLSELSADYYHYLCISADCSEFAPFGIHKDWPVIGWSRGKYLGVTDPATIGRTVIGADGQPAYKAYFNLFNPDTPYNEAVADGDYSINIQVVEDGLNWQQNGSTATYITNLAISDLRQESGASPIFSGSSFGADDSNTYEFFHEISDIDSFLEFDKSYKLYVTTIWLSHPRTGVDEPIDQKERDFSPGSAIFLEDIGFSYGDEATSTTGNWVWNLGSVPASTDVNFSENLSNFSVSSPLPINFALNPGEQQFFQIDFNSSDPFRAVTSTGTLFGEATTESFIGSDEAGVIMKGSGPPDILDIDSSDPATFCPQFPGYSPPAYLISWTYYDVNGSSESRFDFQVDDNDDFSSPEIDRRFCGLDNPSPTTNNQAVSLEISPVSSSRTYCVGTPDEMTVNTPDAATYGEKLYYFRARVWNKEGLTSDWVPAPGSKQEPFFTPYHPYPKADFSYNPYFPIVNQGVYFTDESESYGGAEIVSWDWLFNDGNPSSSTVQNPQNIVFSNFGFKDVVLTIKDFLSTEEYKGGIQYTCSATKTIYVGKPLPRWREVAPR